jgi:hypothetical protein
MNCLEFWSEADRQAVLSAELRSHLDGCSACSARWERRAELSAGLRTLADDWRQVGAPERVEAGLRAAYRLHYGGRRAATRSRWTPVLVWASAAAATITMALALMHPARHASGIPGQSMSPHRTVTPTPEMAAADDSLDFENDFVPVPNAARIEPNEDVNLVRVAVPRSTMMSMGIPVNAENASETVLADVVLGADGMARAIRVVEGSSLEEE